MLKFAKKLEMCYNINRYIVKFGFKKGTYNIMIITILFILFLLFIAVMAILGIRYEATRTVAVISGMFLIVVLVLGYIIIPILKTIISIFWW